MFISKSAATPLGDVRRAQRGDTVWITSDAPSRGDFSHYLIAITSAVARGAEIRQVAASPRGNHAPSQVPVRPLQGEAT